MMLFLLQQEGKKLFGPPPPKKKKEKKKKEMAHGYERSRYGYMHKCLSIPASRDLDIF